MIILVMGFTFHIPITITWADSSQSQKAKPQYILRIGTIAPPGISYTEYIVNSFRKFEELIHSS